MRGRQLSLPMPMQPVAQACRWCGRRPRGKRCGRCTNSAPSPGMGKTWIRWTGSLLRRCLDRHDRPLEDMDAAWSWALGLSCPSDPELRAALRDLPPAFVNKWDFDRIVQAGAREFNARAGVAAGTKTRIVVEESAPRVRIAVELESDDVAEEELPEVAPLRVRRSFPT